jgi:hypothetical protein
MIEARIHLPTPPTRLRYDQLMALAEVLTESNAHWFGDQFAKAAYLEGRGLPGKKPPCCLSCAKPRVLYRPPPPGAKQRSQNWWSAPQVLARGRATCLDAAAYDAGAARAEGKRAYVLLEPIGEPTLPHDLYSTLDFHAVAVINGERVDSSRNLEKGSNCPCK